MWNSRIAEEFRQEGLQLHDYFDGTVTSFEEKCIKPDAEIFERVVSKLGIQPEETLFFDDSQANVDAAAALGFNIMHVAPARSSTTLSPRRASHNNITPSLKQ